MHLGRLRLEVRALRRTDPPLPEAHRGQALPVRGVQPQLLALRPPGPAHEEAPELSAPPRACRAWVAHAAILQSIWQNSNYKLNYIYKKEKENKKLEVYILYI